MKASTSSTMSLSVATQASLNRRCRLAGIRRACREATSPLPRRPGGRHPSPADERLDA
jgi:hypothetical protein